MSAFADQCIICDKCLFVKGKIRNLPGFSRKNTYEVHQQDKNRQGIPEKAASYASRCAMYSVSLSGKFTVMPSAPAS